MNLKWLEKNQYTDQSIGIAIVAVSLIRVVVSQYLYADGSWQILYITSNHHFYLDPGREFMQFFAQVLALISIKAGAVHSYHLVSILLGIGYQLLPTGFLVTAMRLKKIDPNQSQLIRVASLVVFVLASSTMSESYFAASLLILIVAIIGSISLYKKPIMWPILISLLTITIRCYDSYSLFAIVIFANMWIRRKNLAQYPYFLSLAVVLTLASEISSVYYSLKRHSVFGLQQFVQLFNVQNYALIALLAFIFLGGFIKLKYQFVVLIVLGYFVTIVSFNHGNGNQFANRIPASILIFVILIYGSTSGLRLIRHFSISSTALILIGLIGCSQSASWYMFEKEVKSAIDTHSGLLTFERSGISVHDFERGGWSWTNPSLSVVLRKTSKSAILLNPSNYAGWQPWTPDPESVKTFKWSWGD